MNNDLAALSFYLLPVLAQIALPYLVAALILMTRLNDIAFGLGTARFYESYTGTGGPPLVQRTTSQLANLFEFPVLFLVLICLLVAANHEDPMMKAMAWLFVGSRWAHTVVHLTINRLWLRLPVFMSGNLILLAMWGRLAYLVHVHPVP